MPNLKKNSIRKRKVPKRVKVRVTYHDSWSGPKSYELSFYNRRWAEKFIKDTHAPNIANWKKTKQIPEVYSTAKIIL